MLSSMLLNFIKSAKNSQKKVLEEKICPNPDVYASDELRFTNLKLSLYRKFIQWNSDEFPPLFPYALTTHLQFTIVNHPNFPFAPFGLIHKSEKINCLKPLTRGQWQANIKVKEYRPVDRGYEIDIETELKINGELVWVSLTTAFKKTKNTINKKQRQELNISSPERWSIPSGHGTKYGLISLNIDPIHMSKFTAKLMGHKSAIMHGMWTVARGLSEIKNLKYPFSLNVNFLSPIYIPTEVQFVRDEYGFSIYSSDGKRVHLQATLSY
jgi:hypothetical protein